MFKVGDKVRYINKELKTLPFNKIYTVKYTSIGLNQNQTIILNEVDLGAYIFATSFKKFNGYSKAFRIIRKELKRVKNEI